MLGFAPTASQPLGAAPATPTNSATGTAAGTSTAAAVSATGSSTVTGTGTAAGTSTARATGSATSAATATAAGTSTATGVGSPVDATAPTVSIASSSSSVTSAGSYTLTATASDNVGVAYVEFYRGATLIGTDSVSPYTATESVTIADNGSRTYTAKAFDAAGNSTVSGSTTVTINIAAPADTTAPVMTGSLSFTGITSTGFTVNYPAATDAVGVAGYEISIDNGATYAYISTGLSYACTGDAPSTIYYVKVRAYDAAGNRSTPLAGTVTTSAAAPGADTTAPVMVGSIASSNIKTSSFTLTWQAATDSVGVTSYQVSIDGGTTYTDVGNVLTVTETGLASSTAYSTRVRAIDAAANLSTPLSLSVSTAAPASTVTSVTVSPSGGTGSRLFTASVNGTNSPSQSVTWATTAGSIATNGQFTAPAPISTIRIVTVTATSNQDGSKSGTATVTIPAAVSSGPLEPNENQLYVGQKRHRSMTNFAPKRAAEVEIFTLDFTQLLDTGETITSQSWSVTPIRGVDANAASMVQGTASLSGALVSQLIGGGVPGVFYAPICTVTTTSGQTLILPESGEGTLLVTA